MCRALICPQPESRPRRRSHSRARVAAPVAGPVLQANMPRTKVFYFIPNLQQGGAEGPDPGAHQPAAAPLRAGAVRVSRRRDLLRRALSARPAGARSGRPPDEPGRARAVDRHLAPREAGHRPLVPRQGELLGALGGGARRRPDDDHRLPQPDDGAALPGDGVVSVAVFARHPRQLDRRRRTSWWAGRGSQPTRCASSTICSTSSISGRPPRRAQRGARALAAATRRRARCCCPGASACRSTRWACCVAMRTLARRGAWPRDVVVLFAGRERDRHQRGGARAGAGSPLLAPQCGSSGR